MENNNNINEEYAALAEKETASEVIFDGVMLHVLCDDVVLPNGKPAKRELIRHVGAVAVLPVDGEGNVYLERQFRYPVGKVITEVPAGKLDSKSEDRLEAAKRELREETGLSAEKWTNLGDFYPAAAYSDEKLTLFIAEELRFGNRELDEDEFLNVYKLPFREILAQVLRGEIPDAKTQAIILRGAAALGYLKTDMWQ